MEQEAGVSLRTLRVDGGASANNFLMQFQADILDAAVVRPSCIETTALGAAYLAGLATGFWKDANELTGNWKKEREFSSSITEEKRAKLLKGWKKAVQCTFAWAKDE
jgi:glycerol kinase